MQSREYGYRQGAGERWEEEQDFGRLGYRDREGGEEAGGRSQEWRRQSPRRASDEQRGHGPQHTGVLGRWPEDTGESGPRRAGPNEGFRTMVQQGYEGYGRTTVSGRGEFGREGGGRQQGGGGRPSAYGVEEETVWEGGFGGSGAQRSSAAGRARVPSGPYTGRGPKGYQRSDQRIREDVCEVLTEHPAIDPSEVEVEVQNGEVTLRGTVEDRRQKRLVEDVLEEIPGVRDVHNQLRVQQGAFGQQGQLTGRLAATDQGESSQSAGGAVAGETPPAAASAPSGGRRRSQP